jgi:5,5'-dehydrodivanillate O-demethylase
VPTWYGPIKDANGRWISSHIINQDVVAWVGQGTIADRSKELLGSSDRGVAMIRNRFFQDMEAVAQGRDPKGVIRDPEVARLVKLPIATPEQFTGSMSRAEWRKDPYFSRRAKRFPWQAGQPAEVYREFANAMGIDPAERDPGELRIG